MKKRNRIVLVILFSASVVFSNRILRYSTATTIELFSVFTSGLIGGLIVSGLLPSNKKDSSE